MKDISDSIINRYSVRLKKYGSNVKTLGWGSKEQQLRRFDEFLKYIPDIKNKSIVDIGCGLGDFYSYVGKSKCKSYTGIDINPDLINTAKKNFEEDKSVKFMCKNLTYETSEKPISNIGIMIGVLNLNFKGKIDNLEFTKRMISNALTYVDEILLVDFISSHVTKDYPREDFIFYHDPTEILNFALGLSNNISLIHNYSPIPQKEFLICIHKNENI